jgi:hypothetical protein
MTLDELKSKLPAGLQSWADTFGKDILAMSAVEIQKFITLLVIGDESAAYKVLCDVMPGMAAVEEARKQTADLNAANIANKASIDLQHAALTKLLTVLLAIALTTVGL